MSAPSGKLKFAYDSIANLEQKIVTLRASAAAAEARAERLARLLRVAVRQNEHDMLMTGEELRECSAALAEGEV